MPRYLDPKNDLVFKKIFGEHPDLLMDFLNALLPADGLIVALEYLTPEQIPVIPGLLKRGIVDVKCRDQQGRTFIVEMQWFWTPAFQQRMLFSRSLSDSARTRRLSASQAYVQQLSQGAPYQALQPVYALGLINSVFDRASDDWYHHYKIVNIDKPARELKGLQFVFVELPKFRPESIRDKRVMVLWLRFLREIQQGEYDPPAELLEYPPTQAALALAMEAAFSREELLAYQEYLDAIRTEMTLLEERTEMARQEGHQSGLAKGLEQGRQEERLAIARNLLDLLDDAAIAAKTGLPPQAVAQLRNERDAG